MDRTEIRKAFSNSVTFSIILIAAAIVRGILPNLPGISEILVSGIKLVELLDILFWVGIVILFVLLLPNIKRLIIYWIHQRMRISEREDAVETWNRFYRGTADSVLNLLSIIVLYNVFMPTFEEKLLSFVEITWPVVVIQIVFVVIFFVILVSAFARFIKPWIDYAAERVIGDKAEDSPTPETDTTSEVEPSSQD